MGRAMQAMVERLTIGPSLRPFTCRDGEMHAGSTNYCHPCVRRFALVAEPLGGCGRRDLLSLKKQQIPLWRKISSILIAKTSLAQRGMTT